MSTKTCDAAAGYWQTGVLTVYRQQGRLLMGGVCHERITLNHHFVCRPLLLLLGLFTSVYAPTSSPPTVPESDIMVIDNKNL